MNGNPQIQALMELAGRQQQQAAPQQQQIQAAPPNPLELVQAGLMALMLGLDQLGLTETGARVVETVKRSIERMTKMTGGGRQAAALGGMIPPTPPPGVGNMPNI